MYTGYRIVDDIRVYEEAGRGGVEAYLRCQGMSKLRIHEEELRKPSEMSIEDRRRVEKIIEDMLPREERVKLVVLHGGFFPRQ